MAGNHGNRANWARFYLVVLVKRLVAAFEQVELRVEEVRVDVFVQDAVLIAQKL